jgi:hypothetical protein
VETSGYGLFSGIRRSFICGDKILEKDKSTQSASQPMFKPMYLCYENLYSGQSFSCPTSNRGDLESEAEVLTTTSRVSVHLH